MSKIDATRDETLQEAIAVCESVRERWRAFSNLGPIAADECVLRLRDLLSAAPRVPETAPNPNPNCVATCKNCGHCNCAHRDYDPIGCSGFEAEPRAAGTPREPYRYNKACRCGGCRAYGSGEHVNPTSAPRAAETPQEESPVLAFQVWLEKFVAARGRKVTQDEYSLLQTGFFAAHPGKGPSSTLQSGAAGTTPPRPLEPECPGPDCQRCSGDYCDTHFTAPCECDSADRHLAKNGNLTTAEPPAPRTLTLGSTLSYDEEAALIEQLRRSLSLNEQQHALVRTWAADDRLWTTQTTVEINLGTFARSILAASDRSEPIVATDSDRSQPVAAPVRSGDLRERLERAIIARNTDTAYPLVQPEIDFALDCIMPALREAAASLAPVEAPAWQSMETAPKDGTDVLLCWSGGLVLSGYYGEHKTSGTSGWWTSRGFYSGSTLLKPTGWMPLPAAPGQARTTDAPQFIEPVEGVGVWDQNPDDPFDFRKTGKG